MTLILGKSFGAVNSKDAEKRIVDAAKKVSYNAVMTHYLITGASRGLGRAMSAVLLERGAHVIGTARSEGAPAFGSPERLDWISSDLSLADAPQHIAQRAHSLCEHDSDARIYLINNAGVVGPLGPVGELDSEAIQRHISINLTAPLCLTNELVKLFGSPRIFVCNITSGFASRPAAGVSAYCSTKAGLDMFTRVIAEQADAGLRSCAISPGTIDTDMQGELRASTDHRFPPRERFVKLKESGELSDPRRVAEKIVDALDDPGLASGSVLHVRDLS
jgi:benzil reductase ((S)-benzoin forming)